jgi:hypothetical protein
VFDDLSDGVRRKVQPLIGSGTPQNKKARFVHGSHSVDVRLQIGEDVSHPLLFFVERDGLACEHRCITG